METVSRPGSPLRINLGDSYAQPTISFDAISGGNELSRMESYLGNRNCCAPYTSEEERIAENVAEAGEKKNPHAAELEILKREYAIRDKAAEIFILGSGYA